MKLSPKTPHFEVDFKERLAQARVSRLPLLGYKQYRVYDIEKKSDIVYMNYKQSKLTWQQTLLIFIDEMESFKDTFYNTQWLKPKQATLLRMKGHRVEEVE